MSRSKKVRKRPAEQDILYNNRLLNRFINQVMKDGKKTVAQALVYKALDNVKSKEHDPIKVFETALRNIGPRMEVRSRRVGGASYQVPTEVRGDRRISLAIRWIIAAAKKRSSKDYRSFDQKLSAEFLDAANNEGEAIRKKNLVHKMAESNRAFAHFRW